MASTKIEKNQIKWKKDLKINRFSLEMDYARYIHGLLSTDGQVIHIFSFFFLEMAIMLIKPDCRSTIVNISLKWAMGLPPPPALGLCMV